MNAGVTADGYVRAEGCGAIVLRLLSAARAAKESVYACVIGSAVNSDGRSNGLTAPNPAAQEDVLRRALASARIAPSEVGCVYLLFGFYFYISLLRSYIK
jgi:acyl transferase domain-containing protein